jgi:hypothetical protein
MYTGAKNRDRNLLSMFYSVNLVLSIMYASPLPFWTCGYSTPAKACPHHLPLRAGVRA